MQSHVDSVVSRVANPDSNFNSLELELLDPDSYVYSEYGSKSYVKVFTTQGSTVHT